MIIYSNFYLKGISYFLMFLFIILVIPLHLFPCFISGFLSYELVTILILWIDELISNTHIKWIIIFSCAVSFFVILIFGIIELINSLTIDLQRNIDLHSIIDHIFLFIKKFLQSYLYLSLPENSEGLKYQLFSLLKSNFISIQNISKNFLHSLVTVLTGFIIGIIISLSKPFSHHETYLIKQLLTRLQYLSQAFKNIIFAQIQISLINTVLTSIMIIIVFPIFNIYLPTKKTLIILTFIFGLFPIIGNLISNFIITISAFSISLHVGGIMIIYLILIHKLEYFLNAEIVGNHIRAKSWEILLAMLVFESLFGLQGLIAAPIYYSYLKIELKKENLI